MKKIKLLNPILCTTVLAGTIIPLASCSQSQETYVSALSSKTKYYMHGIDSDPYPVFVFELKNALADGQYILATAQKTKGTSDVTCSVVTIYSTQKTLLVWMKLDNFMNVDDYVKFNLKLECKDKNNNNVWTQTINDFKLIASLSYENVVHNLYESTITEFIEYVKNPHPSNPNPTHTLENDTLNQARNYLKNKIEALGYTFNRDTYGNMWFDVPATPGYENYPKLILEGHMDMVCKGFKDELEARTQGIEVERHFIDILKNGETYKAEVLQSKGTAEIFDHHNDPEYVPTHRSTSLGADDGIAIAIALAIIQDPYISHGPLRMLFTSDEEPGMYGAAALDPSVLDTDYLLCIDGEGSIDKPYVVCKGCYGFADYQYNNTFSMTNKTQSNVFTIKLDKFKGEHFTADVHFVDGKATMFGNPDDVIFELFNTLKNAGKKIELSVYTHERVDSDTQKVGKMNAKDAKVTFATDATIEEVSTALDTIMNAKKDIWIAEDWTTIDQITWNVKEDTQSKFLSIDDTNKLLGIFGTKIKYEISHWDGDDVSKEEMAKRDYPTAASNFSWTELDANGKFYASSRGNGATIGYNNQYKENNSKAWTDVFGESGLVKLSIHDPWDPTGKEDLLDLTEAGYIVVQGSYDIDKVRGGVEPAYFSHYRPSIQNSCIGPWLENIHKPGETLYLETLPGVIKCTLFIIDNMWTFAK